MKRREFMDKLTEEYIKYLFQQDRKEEAVLLRLIHEEDKQKK